MVLGFSAGLRYENPFAFMIQSLDRILRRQPVNRQHFFRTFEFLDFQETFPDNGDVNLVRAMRVYKQIGYDGMIMPDHAPQIDGDTSQRQAFAFEYGYIRALLQAVENEA